MSVEEIVWDTPVSVDRPRVRELFTLHYRVDAAIQHTVAVPQIAEVAIRSKA